MRGSFVQGSRGARLAVAVALGAALARPAPTVSAAPRQARASLPTEYDVKAAFLYNFAKFVEWPEASLPTDGTFVLGVLGSDPFGRALEELDGRTVLGRRIVVRRYEREEDAAACQILFISSSEEERLPAILAALLRKPVLTVSDGDGWAERGVIINFKTRQSKIRFEINLERAEMSRLRMSSQLLKLASLVPPVVP